jgi:hypothetical protein
MSTENKPQTVTLLPENAEVYNFYMQTQEWRQQSKCEVNTNPKCNTEEQRIWLLFEEDRIKRRDKCTADYFVQ